MAYFLEPLTTGFLKDTQDSPTIVSINANTVDLNNVQLHADGHCTDDVQRPKYILIICKQDIIPSMRGELKRLGAEVSRYASRNTYICRYESPCLEPLRRLDFVLCVSHYHRFLKIHKELKKSPEHVEELALFIELHEVPQDQAVTKKGTRLVDQVAAEIGQIPGVSSCTAVSPTQLIAKASRDSLKDIVAIEVVRVIGRDDQPVANNNLARVVLGLDTAHTTIRPDGAISAMPNTQYAGAGQIVTLADTGLDLGSKRDIHAAFGNRVIHLQGVGRWEGPGEGGLTDDPDGHGTHMAACVVGMDTTTATGDRVVIQGTAPAANLIMQSIVGGDQHRQLNPPRGDMMEEILFQPAYDRGSRIHSNSWSVLWEHDLGQRYYGARAQAVDRFVFLHPDFVVLVAAGNDHGKLLIDGRRPSAEVGGLASAKNCITVGASQSSRPCDGSKFDPSLRKEDMDTLAVCHFSNVGPTRERRMKPDIVAPGSSILSARSRHYEAYDDGSGGVSEDNHYMFMSGTSPATALVAGCVAVIREALLTEYSEYSELQAQVQQPGLFPSAALIKALLIHYARPMHGNRLMRHPKAQPDFYPFPTTPFRSYGYGRVDVAAVLAAISRNETLQTRNWHNFRDLQIQLDKGVYHDMPVPWPYPMEQSDGGFIVGHLTLKVTLVYLDPPDPDIRNHLSLSIMHSTIDSVRTCTSWECASPHHWDNVQQLSCQPVYNRERPDIEVIVRVRAGDTLAEPYQKFAVVWSWQQVTGG